MTRSHRDRGRDDPLVMTLVVRDEADIIEPNLRFHLSHGVDHVVVLDNGSTDGTTEILDRYAREGYLTLYRGPSDSFEQEAWVARLIEAVRQRFGQAWILPNDADEFWWASGGDAEQPGDLRSVVRESRSPLVLCNRANLIAAWPMLDDAHWSETLVWRSRISDRKPPGETVREVSRLSHPMFAYRMPGKVIAHTRGLVSVSHGGHTASFECEQTPADLGIEILHLPVRSTREFLGSIERAQRLLADARRGQGRTPSPKYLRWVSMLEQDPSGATILSDALPSRLRLWRYSVTGRVRRDTRLRDELLRLRLGVDHESRDRGRERIGRV